MTLFITELALGGTPRRVQALAERLDRSRFEPYVLSLMPGGSVAAVLEAAGVPVEPLDVRSKLDLGSVFRLRDYLRRVRPLVLHAFNFHANLLAKLVRKWLAPVPVVIVSEASVETAKPRIRVVLDRWTARWADAHYVNAEAVRDKLMSREGVPADRISTVHTGVNTKVFAPQLPDESLRRKHGIPPGERVVASVGRLDKYKGQKFLLRALKVAVQQGRPYYLVLVGDGPLRPDLEDQARAEGISDRVIFAGAQEDVAPFLTIADCVVLPSTEEGLPASLLEAMAMARPVVAAEVGGVPETFSTSATVFGMDGRNSGTVAFPPGPAPEAVAARSFMSAKREGVLVPPSDAGALARAIAAVLADPARAQAMGQAARERVEREFSVDRMVRETEAMYQRLVAAADRGAAGGRPR